MPIYEYECQACSQCSEVLVRGADERIVCPKCGSDRLTRILSTFSARSDGNSTSDACGSCEIGSSCPSVGRSRGPCCGGSCNH